MVKIFAKYNTDEKVIINAPTDIKNSKITTYLEKKYGGSWILVDELHPGESVLIKDGVKYKGRGLIQITGRHNYTLFQKYLGGAPDIMNHPEYLEQPHLAVMVSCWFWKTHGLNELADTDSFVTITKKINGGTNGINERKAFLIRAKKELIK